LGELVDPGGVGGLGLEGNCQEEEGGQEAHLGSLSEMGWIGGGFFWAPIFAGGVASLA
jgi:hypothetical protein